MSNTGDFTAWNLWLMRNCAGCTVNPCPKYHRHYAAATSWRQDYATVPNCVDKVMA